MGPVKRHREIVLAGQGRLFTGGEGFVGVGGDGHGRAGLV